MISGFSIYTEATALGTAAGASSSSSAVSSRAPSTVGGRRAQRRENEAAKSGKSWHGRGARAEEVGAGASPGQPEAPGRHVVEEAEHAGSCCAVQHVEHQPTAGGGQPVAGQLPAAAMLEVNIGPCAGPAAGRAVTGAGDAAGQQQLQQQQQGSAMANAAAGSDLSWK